MPAHPPKDNPSIPEEHLPTDKYFTDDGRKLKDLPQVGVASPDTDADRDPGRSTKPPRDRR